MSVSVLPVAIKTLGASLKYTLKQLQVFLAVARHQNISRAAQELHMSQSATSEALLNLEHSYEIALFDRARNKLALNAVGHTVRKEAEALLAHCQSFEQALLAHLEVGHIKVGASFTIGNHLATRYLAGYLAQYHDADVQLDIANTRIDWIVLTTPNIQTNIAAATQARLNGYRGRISASARFKDEIEQLNEAGVDAVFNIYEEAGRGLAAHFRQSDQTTA